MRNDLATCAADVIELMTRHDGFVNSGDVTAPTQVTDVGESRAKGVVQMEFQADFLPSDGAT